MKEEGLYVLPELPYEENALEPFISKEQLRLHHDKHHQAYVNAANALFGKLADARRANLDIDVKAMARELSFNIGGHVLHSLFWENMQPAQGVDAPFGASEGLLTKEFGGFDRFKMEFSKAAQTTEGSGWAALSYCRILNRPIIMQIEKHNMYVNPAFSILLVLDVWEHAYYLDYKNDRAKFIEGFWNLVNWDTVNKRIAAL